MLSLLMQQIQNIQEHGDLDGNLEPALSFAVIIIKKKTTAFGSDSFSHIQTCFTAIRKRAFLESSVTKNTKSLGGQLLLGLGPGLGLLSDAGRDFIHPGSMAHGMHLLSSTIPLTVEAGRLTTYLSVSNPQTSSPSMRTPG